MALEEVNFDIADDQYTVLVHGDTGAGKTYFASSFPKALFLSASDEKGWETIRWMSPDRFYDGVRPKVWKLQKATDLVEAHKDAQALINRGEIKTIVVDSLTFWVEMFYDYLIQQAGTNRDTRQIYGMLGDHLRNVRIKFHALKCNVVWLCTTKPPDETNKSAIPDIKGKSSLTYPAGCKYVWYMRSQQDGKKISYYLHTKRYGVALARGRDGGKLPDPILDPTYTKIHESLQGLSQEDFVDQTEEELIEDAQNGEVSDTPNIVFPTEEMVVEKPRVVINTVPQNKPTIKVVSPPAGQNKPIHTVKR